MEHVRRERVKKSDWWSLISSILLILGGIVILLFATGVKRCDYERSVKCHGHKH